MILKILLENLDFSIEKIDFSIEKIDFSIEKIEIFVPPPNHHFIFDFFQNRKFQNHFSPRKKKVFRSIFFSASGDVNTSRIYAQSSLGIPYCPATLGFMEQLPVTTLFLEDLSYTC